MALFKNLDYADDVTDEEIANAETAWKNYKAGNVKTLTLEELKRCLNDSSSDFSLEED